MERRIAYTDMDRYYSPQVVSFMGNGQHFMEESADTSDFMLGGVISWLFGKPQSWYDRIDRIQKALVLCGSEISTIGKELWDTVAGKLAGRTRDVGLSYFWDYDRTMDEITSCMKSILVTKSSGPTDAQINLAEQRAKDFGAQVAYVKKVAPEIAAQVEKARQESAAMMTGRLRSPAEAGEAAFVKSLEEQASKLSFGIGGLGIGIAAVVGLVVLGPMLAGRKRRENPRRRRRRRSEGGLEKIMPLVIGGGATIFLLSSLMKAKAAPSSVPGMTVAAGMPSIAATAAAPTGYADAIAKIDDLKTLYRSGRLDAVDAKKGADAILGSVNALYREGKLTVDQFTRLDRDLKAFVGAL